MGRFLSEDPLQHDGGMNFYGFIPIRRFISVHEGWSRARVASATVEHGDETGAPGKSFRAQSLHYVDAGGACRREHRSDYRRA
jgi:hypothetical protein